MFFLIASEQDTAPPFHRVDTEPFLESDRSSSGSPPNTTRGDVEEAPITHESPSHTSIAATSPQVMQQKSKCFWVLIICGAVLLGGLLYILVKAFI